MFYICADDYGVSVAGNERIELCAEKDKINKASVFVNGELGNIDKLIEDENLELSLHINLVEGKALCSPDELSLLTTSDGYFKHSFTGLLKLSLSKERKEFERQVYKEIKAQIDFFKKRIAKRNDIAIDSHQHTHMIPSIFNVLMQVIKDGNLEIRYIRMPCEPILPYIKTPSIWLSLKPVNLIKQWLLRFFEMINDGKLEKSGIPTAYFMGILFSGHMDKERVEKVFFHYRKLAEKNGEDIELLFHPGHMLPDETDLEGKTFKEFYFSKGRDIEFDALMNLDIEII